MNFVKQTKKNWAAWRARRMLNNYYFQDRGIPPGARFFRFLLLYLFLSLLILWKTSSFSQAAGGMALLFIIMLVVARYRYKKELELLKAKCHQGLVEREFTKRLDKKDEQQILELLGHQLAHIYPLMNMELVGDRLEGSYQGERIAVLYQHLGEGEIMETREVMYSVREMRQLGFKRIRVFTNGDFSVKSDLLGERYDVDLKLYNGVKLMQLLKETSLYPTEAEIEIMVRREMEKRNRKLYLIKRQMLQKSKTWNYLIYSLFLYVLTWYEIGYVYWNLFFAILMLGLSLWSLLAGGSKEEDEIVF